ncbi:MAG: tetratricopeptide repeat protein [Tannerellaceae bacterium]|jgi:tetratricopeptide (TPR) repeat protein|nr:tetratricopeptide repeat protein [Tannerellaceae bacterium]
MTLQEINQAYNRIVGLLDNKELKSAFDSLQSFISGSREYAFQDKLNEMQETYKNMLRYRMDGVKDPMQGQIYQSIRTSAYELADQLRHTLLTAGSSLAFYSRRRNLQPLQGITLNELQAQLPIHYNTGNRARYEEILSLLFNRIWVSDWLTPDECEAVKKIWTDDRLPFAAACQTVSALILGLQAAFDKEKLLLLFDAAQLSGSEEVRIRALIGILLTLYIYRKRTSLYPKIAGRLAALAEEPGFTQNLRTITLRFILARETEKITRKLQDEIIPEMIRLSPKINRKINPGDFYSELPDEKNPEWKDIFADSSLGKKMEEFSELQQEGADIMHSTFIHLKHFPFFREMSNWFLPFTSEHSLFGNRFKTDSRETNILETMTEVSFMCNSDKYSLYFSMMQLPEETRRMMVGQFNSQAAEMIEQNRDELTGKRGKAGIIAGQYIQDLYRFFKLYPARLDFDDIFVWPLDFHNLPVLQPYMSDEESLTSIAEYYLRKNYFDDALTIYDRLAKTQKESEMLFQKIGYCKQMREDVHGALEAYLHADLLHTGSKWLIRRIAGCYRSLKQPAEALTYYRRYEELSPDNLSVQMNIGHCHLELKAYNEALKYYFKVDYLDTKSHKAWRPIAWCSFLTGRYDQARNYYRKIIKEDNPGMHDLLNAGHTEWALQNNKKAIDFYLQAIRKEEGSFYKFREQFMQDIPDLTAAGIDESEVPLMLDQLKYLMEIFTAL